MRNGYYRDPNYTFNSSYGTRYADLTDNNATEQVRIDNAGINEYDSCRIVYINKPNIHIIGQSRDNVIIATDRLDGSVSSDHSKVWYHINAGATIEVQANGTDFHMENLTVDNENWTKLKMEGPQALCFNISGDRAVLNNVRTRSYQDTYYNGGTYNRSFWNNSELHGAVDFIYGASDVWFENCVLDINRKTGGFIVAPNHPEATRWGYVFNNTRITSSYFDAQTGSIWLGRPWHNAPKTVFINTQTFINIPAKGWYNTMGGLPALWADYNTVDANGNPVDLSQRESYYYYIDSSTGDKVEAFNVKNYLTDEEAAQYTIKNVMGGEDNWQPDLLCEATEAPAPVFNDNTISWDEVPYAICYVVTRGDEVVAITTETSVDVNAVVSAKGSAALGANDSEEPYKVQSVNEQGGLSKFGIATDATALNAVSAAKGAKSNVYYNIAGQRVNSSFKGMVISDGKKYMK